jgi:hypothetical protein
MSMDSCMGLNELLKINVHGKGPYASGLKVN